MSFGFDGRVPTELKLADKWSGPDLFERLENELAGDYLDVTFGVWTRHLYFGEMRQGRMGTYRVVLIAWTLKAS